MDQRSVLHERLMSLERGFSSMTEYMNSAQSIADAFTAINNPLSEDDLITCILHSTNLSSPFKASYMNSLSSTFVLVFSSLLFYANQHPYQTTNTRPQPCSLSNRSQGRNHNTQYRLSQTSMPPTNNQQTPMTTGPSTCQIRKKTSHIANRRRFTDQGSSSSNGNNTLAAGLHVANTQEETGPTHEQWKADFGASTYMASSSDTKSQPYEEEKVMLGDDKHLSIAHVDDTAGSRSKRKIIAKGIGVRVIFASLKWREETNKNGHQNMEVFFKNCGLLAPKRYKYSDIKKMTNFFQQKLGEGGFGSVFKGQLNNGMLVAVKVFWNKYKNDGEGFINEVASNSRTSHVNIVTLHGFCYEKKKMALIYEFMPNGSLEKIIYNKTRSNQIGWETLHQISIGIARGLEYLHLDCNTHIIHFDIKPHNVLLDQDFCPKISDFGLAKLFLRKESMVSISCARGTIGYIAPEVFCRNFERVSYKSDVYSYGMMLLEMVVGRKNIDAFVEHSSRVYFPHWIYKRLERNEDIGLHGVLIDLHGFLTEEREELARKMIIVGLWCIQTNPLSRPSMSKVLEMLEGTIDALQIPPNPMLSYPTTSPPVSSSTSVSSSIIVSIS